MADTALQEERKRLVDGLVYLEGDSDEYRNTLANISTMQKLEEQDKEIELKEKELELKQQELDIQAREPTLADRAIEWAKAFGPTCAAVVGGIFSLITIRHITKHEKSDDLYYGSKAMSFVKKP